MSTDADRGASGYSEYVVLRNDSYGWQSGTYSTTIDGITYVYNKTTAAEAEPVITDGATSQNGNTNNWYTSFESYFKWEDDDKNNVFPALMDGSKVKLTVKREWAKVTIHADITGSDNNQYWEEFVMNCGLGGLPIRAFLSVDHSHITDLTSSLASTSGIEESSALYERGTIVRPWIESDINEWTKSANSVIRTLTNSETGIKIDTYAGALTKNVSCSDGKIYNYDIVWNVGASYGNGNTSYLKIGDYLTFTTSSQDQFGKITIGSNDYSISNACNKDNGNRDGDQWTIHLVVNTFTKKIESLSITGNKGKNKVNYSIPSELVIDESANYNNVLIGITRPSSASSLWTAIKSIVVSERSTAKITTEFVDQNGNKLKSDLVEEKNFGELFTPTYDTTINTEFKRYNYISGGDAVTVAGDMKCTIVYNTAWQDSYGIYNILYAQDYDATISADWTTATGGRYTPVIREETVEHYLSVDQTQRQNNGTTLTCSSIKDVVSAGKNFTMIFDIKLGSSNNQVGPEFVIYDAANSAKLFSLKAINTYTTTWKVNDDSDCTVTLPGSGSENNSTTSDNIGNLTWYKIKLVFYGGKEYISIFNKSTGELITPTIIKTPLSETGGLGNMTFSTSRYMANFAIDNILVRDFADGDITKTVIVASAAGWATLFTPDALDFENVENLTAYTASVSENTVTLTEVKNVPANTGVVLKGAADTYSVPVIANSETAQGDLKGSATDGLTYDENAEYDYYMLAINKQNQAQFTKLISGTIAAGKAYLVLSKATGARSLNVVFEDETTTDINVVENLQLTNDDYFNLSGQRVAVPQKGLYIVNGKKVVKK